MKVYIASPYTLGDKQENVKLQLDIFDSLMSKGFTPFAPLWGHFQHSYSPRSYEDWIRWDLKWLEICDYVLRLGGESKGADIEVSRAKELNIPVFYSVYELLIFTNTMSL